MAGREFPLSLCTAEDLQGVIDVLDRLMLTLMRELRVEAEDGVTTFQGSWSDGSEDVEIRKDPIGWVHLRGFADHSGSPTPPEHIFTLPEGYRPGVKITAWQGGHVIEVRTDGTVYINSGVGSTTNFTGISFFAEG